MMSIRKCVSGNPYSQRKLFIEAMTFEKGKAYGYQEYLFNLLDYLHANRERVRFDTIGILCVKGEEPAFARFSPAIATHAIANPNYLSRLWCQSFLPKSLNIGKDDVVLYTGNYSGLLHPCKSVLVVHDLLYKRAQWLPNKLMRLQRQFYVPISIKHADKIITISNFTKHDVESFYPTAKGKIDVIYNYFNFRKYGVDEEATVDCLPKPYFISICSGAYHKNTSTVLNAFREYCAQGGCCNLVLVGGMNPMLEQLYSTFENSVQERIVVKKHLSNEALGYLYKNAKAFISASLFEGLGMPIVEAMYFNLPILLTDDDVFHEVSLEKGRYFQPLDVNSLASLMLAVEADESIPTYSDEIKAFYSEINTSEKYITLLNSLTPPP